MMKNGLKVYIVGPMQGTTYDDVRRRFEGNSKMLKAMGYQTFVPIAGMATMEGVILPEGYSDPICNNHAIKTRDRWMVNQSDILFVDLTNTTEVSIGSVSEIAWGEMLGKHIVVIMEKKNVHRHAFILENASIIFETREEGFDYLENLI